MNGMTTQERIDDICKICGLSEDIVKRVMTAQRESLIGSLKKGERAALIGICVMRPDFRKKVAVGGGITRNIKIDIDVAPSIESDLEDLVEFEASNIQDDLDTTGIRLRQIPSLV